jgi:hypothetical protein
MSASHFSLLVFKGRSEMSFVNVSDSFVIYDAPYLERTEVVWHKVI